MSVRDDPGRGRLVLVTGTDAAARVALGTAIAARLAHAVVVDGAALERLVRVAPVGASDAPEDGGRDEAWSGAPTPEQLMARLLRWSAALAVAEVHQLEGHDAVVIEEATGERLADLLDLLDPEPVHVVVIADGLDATTPRWGLWVAGTDPVDTTAVGLVARLDEALVETAGPVGT
ncbi:MAG: hypothetical protein ABI336_12205 [Humibacillus sp.]